MNFCSDCGKDLRIAHETRFCEQCGREFLGPVALRETRSTSQVASEKNMKYEEIREIILDIAGRFDFKTTPPAVANFYKKPPVSVNEDVNFDIFDDGSVDEKQTFAKFAHHSNSIPDLEITYKFINKDVSFYSGERVFIDGLCTVFIQPGFSLSRTALHELFGSPTNSQMLNNFDSVDFFNLNTPSGGQKGNEEFVAYFKATSPECTDSIWIQFPEM